MFRSILPMIAGLSLLIAGCEKHEPTKVSAKDVEKKMGEAGGAAVDYARQERDEYVARVQKAVDEASAKIDELKTRAKKAPANAKSKLKRQIKVMEGRWKVAERKLRELKSASSDAWKDLKSGVDRAIEDLKR